MINISTMVIIIIIIATLITIIDMTIIITSHVTLQRPLMLNLIFRDLIMPLIVQQRAWLLRAIAEIDQVHALDPVAEVVEDERLVGFRGADRHRSGLHARFHRCYVFVPRCQIPRA